MGDKGIEELVGEHFGKVPTYTLVDTNTNDVKVIDNTSEHMGGIGYPPEIIAKSGAEVLLCGGVGGRAVAMFEQYGIMVYIGASGTVKDALQLWKDGKLQPATDENASKHHGSNEHGQGHEGCGHH